MASTERAVATSTPRRRKIPHLRNTSRTPPNRTGVPPWSSPVVRPDRRLPYRAIFISALVWDTRLLQRPGGESRRRSWLRLRLVWGVFRPKIPPTLLEPEHVVRLVRASKVNLNTYYPWVGILLQSFSAGSTCLGILL